jgi:hypothetical protein
MIPAEMLRQFVDALLDAAVPYMLTGSHASSAHGIARSTVDIDFVIAPSREEIRQLVQRLQAAGCYVDMRAANEALNTHGQFNAIHIESGWKADLIIRKPRAFSRTEFERREPATVYGVPVSVATAEDVLIAKLEWAKLGDSSRQIEDAANILRVRAAQLDHPYVERWVEQLGLQAQWAAARSKAQAGE